MTAGELLISRSRLMTGTAQELLQASSVTVHGENISLVLDMESEAIKLYKTGNDIVINVQENDIILGEDSNLVLTTDEERLVYE